MNEKPRKSEHEACRIDHLFTIDDDPDPGDIEALAEYLDVFEKPIRTDGKLVCACGAWLSGFLGSFVWGLVHGEGTCGRCDRYIRFFHRLPRANGEQWGTFNLPLLFRDKGAGDE